MTTSAERLPPRRVLVLGHSGFIGRALCEAMRDRHPDVGLSGLSLEAVDFTDTAAVARLGDALVGTDVLVVLAGIKKQCGDSLETFGRNMAIAANVCDALSERRVPRIVFFSSAEVYGEQTNDTAMTELTPVRPTSYYGIAKFASEGLFRKAAAVAGASLVIVRPPLVYGPGEAAGSYGPSEFARAAVEGKAITLWGDGLERREFLYVADLVDVTRRFIFSSVTGVVNISSGRHSSFRDILAALERALGAPLAIASRPRTRPSVDQGYRNDRLMRIFPDLSFTSLESALKAIIDAERAAVATP